MKMLKTLKTGDLLLCSSGSRQMWPLSWASSLIKTFTQSPYSHIAMVLKDPSFIHPSLSGLFVWESNFENVPDPQDGVDHKFGVRITPLRDFLEVYREQGGVVAARTIEIDTDTAGDEPFFCITTLEKIHDVVYNKPYDLNLTDWLKALDPEMSWVSTTERFWCSALVGYIYKECGILTSSTQWSVMSPADFAVGSKRLTFTSPAIRLSAETPIV